MKYNFNTFLLLTSSYNQLGRVDLKRSTTHLLTIVTSCLLLFVTAQTFAATGSWNSQTTRSQIEYKTTNATSPVKDAFGKYLTVVYLKNLAIKKVGSNSNEEDVAWLLSQGYRVIELDYKNNSAAVSPSINKDIIAINDAIAAGSFGGYKNSSNYRSYVLFEGYRISRDVAYFKDDPTVYNKPSEYTEGDSLHMDIIYPANTSVKVPVVLSFAYANSYATYDGDTKKLIDANKNQRLNLGNTLAGFNDSFLEGAPANGIAWAIADHPKYCPWGGGKPVGGANDAYKSYQVNPDAAQKVKSAVRTLRAKGADLGLSGKIGIYGFSRGSDAGSMAVGDRTVTEFENAGLNISTSDDVQAAALGPGVFDFTIVYNGADDGDGNLEGRCPWVWGSLKDNYALWESMGSAYLAETSATAPVFFFYNTDDQPYYQDQVSNFKAKLDGLGVPTSMMVDYGSGHSVPQEENDLSKLYDFFKQYLTPPSVEDNSTGTPTNAVENGNTISLSPNPATDKLNISFNLEKASTVQFSLCNLSGVVVYKTKVMYNYAGQHNQYVNLGTLNLSQGIYYVNVIRNGVINTDKLMVAAS